MRRILLTLAIVMVFSHAADGAGNVKTSFPPTETPPKGLER